MKVNRLSRGIERAMMFVAHTPRRNIVLLPLVPVLLLSLWLARPASAAISYRDVSSAENGAGATTLSLSMPAGTLTGDTLIAVINVRGGTTTSITPPSGWTERTVSDSTTIIKTATFSARQSVVGAGPYSFTFSSSQKAAGVIVAYGGVDAVVPVDVNGSQANASSTTMTAPSVTTNVTNTMLVSGFGNATTTTFSAVGGTLRGQATSSGGGGATSKVTVGVQDSSQVSAGATGTKTMTAASGAVSTGHLLALKPTSIFSMSGFRFFNNATTSAAESLVKLTNPATMPPSTGWDVAWSPNGAYLVVGHGSTPFITIYKRSGDTFTKLANPASLPPSFPRGVAWSPDGNYLSVASTTTPFITIYKRSGDTFTKLADPATLPPSVSYSSEWSPDGAYLTVTSSSTPFITIYKRSGDTFTKLADPATLPPGLSYRHDWTPDGTYLTIASSASPYVFTYKRSGDTFTKLADPATLPTGSAEGATWSPDGIYLTISHVNAPFITIYKRSGDTLTKLADPATLPTGNAGDSSWSPDGIYMSVAHEVSPFMTTYKRSGDTFTKLADPASLTQLEHLSAKWSPHGEYIAASFQTTPFLSIYKFTPSEAQPGTALGTTQDTPATSPGIGVPFRLRMNLHVTEGSAVPGAALKLQVAERSGTCDTTYTGESYADVGTASGKVRYYDSSSLFDGMGVSTNASNPAHSAHTTIRQSYEEVNNFSVVSPIAIGEDGLWDFSLVFDTSATIGSYCFRVVNADGTALTTPSVVPEISLAAPTVGQANYRYFANADSTAPGSPLATQDTAATIPAETPFRLRQRLAVDTAQLAQAGQNYKLQYAEKSGVCDAGFSGETYQDVVAAGGSFVSTASVARTASEVSSPSGNLSWLNPQNASSNDSAYAILDVMGPDSTPYNSNYLVVSGDLPTVPANSTVLGLRVGVKGVLVGDVFNQQVGIYLDGSQVGSSKAIDLGGGGTYKYAGSSSDLWGATWTPGDINSASSMSVYFEASPDAYFGDAGASIDDMFVEVYYTLPNNLSYHLNPTPLDLATISSNPNDPTNGARPTVYQSYRETDPFTNNVAAIPAGSDGLWDFALTSAAAADGKTYCLRVVKSDGSQLDSYSQIPEITFGSGGGGPAPTEQKLRGGRSVQNGVKSPFEL